MLVDQREGEGWCGSFFPGFYPVGEVGGGGGGELLPL